MTDARSREGSRTPSAPLDRLDAENFNPKPKYGVEKENTHTEGVSSYISTVYTRAFVGIPNVILRLTSEQFH